MPKIPLFTPNPVADASHQVTAPGGYEYWYFDAHDPASDLHMVAMFFDGCPFHPGYLRAFNRYMRRPTRWAPPMPAQYPCVYFALHHGDEVVARFMSQYLEDQAQFAADRPDARIGPHRMHEGAQGVLHLQFASGEFSFRPRFMHEPVVRSIFPRRWSRADHYSLLTDPLCTVTGEFTQPDGQMRAFNGVGYHDHHFGTGPIAPGVFRWMRGRVLLDDHAIIFHLAQPSDAREPLEIDLREVDSMGWRELTVDNLKIDWSHRSEALLPYPDHIQAGPLRLHAPRVIDQSPFGIRLTYNASIRGIAAQGLFEITYPNRLRWPLLGRMIEMSIRK